MLETLLKGYQKENEKLSAQNRELRMLAKSAFRRAMTTTASSSSASANPHAFLLENPLKLYRDCMRLADLLAHTQGHPRETLRATVRAPWRRHLNETDPARVMELREGAVRGLSRD